MTPTICVGDGTKTLRRWQVGPTSDVLPYTNAPPMREDVAERQTIDIDSQIAAVMPSIAEIESMGAEHFREWRDDRSWADYEDK
jgi:hypothetical protein